MEEVNMLKGSRGPEACVSMPYYECLDGVYEIDEFDCSSIFVIVGEDRALVLDTGLGIGDLKWLIENKITDKPYDLALSHNHGDHIGGSAWFGEAYIHPLDMKQTDLCVSPTLKFRKTFAKMFRMRWGKNYTYDPERDIRPWPVEPVFKPMEDGHRFELGGRTVTAYHCPGHTPGEMVFIDDKTRTLFCGDAANGSFLLSAHLADTREKRLDIAINGLERIQMMSDKYDRVYNFHHDFRGYGAPLSDQMIPDVIDGLRAMKNGTAEYYERPNAISIEKELQTVSVYGNVEFSCLSGKITE